MNMSLTTDDLQAIRCIIKDEIKPTHDRVVAVENDVKEIYDVLIIDGIAVV
jgi:hypothetical protein